MTTQTTSDYSKFSLLHENRVTAVTHVNRLKDAIQANPKILEVQPILVNEKHEIIDGQHRFTAAKELGIPISYTVVEGLDVHTARKMNALQRRWTMDDYAQSYAKTGNLNYKAFNKYRQENPGLSMSTIITVLAGKSETSGLNTDFKSGEFTLGRDIEEIEVILDQLNTIRELTMHEIPLNRAFVTAFLQAPDNEDYDVNVFLANLKLAPEKFHRVSVVRDGLRVIEDIYNYRKSSGKIRLY